MLEKGHKSHQIEAIIRLMQNKVEMAKPKPGIEDDDTLYIQDDLNYSELFSLFISKRKLTLLRFLFGLN